MGKRLSENLSSHYFRAANRLNSKQSRRRIVAYVESYDDVFFWRSVLNRFENEKMYFQVMLPSRVNNRLNRGKKAAMMNLFSRKVGEDMIACVDADYDYLVQGATEMSHEVINNPYIFHTYAYAIENLQCYAPSLHETSVMVTLNDHEIFSFEDYLREFSQVIYPLFIWNIWYYRSPNYSDFTMTDFLRVIEVGRFNMSKVPGQMAYLRNKVRKKVLMLQRNNPNAKESYLSLKKELSRLGVTPDNTYLFIQGHHLFEKVVQPMMEKVCDVLIKERESEINSQSVHNTQRRNELACYGHSVENINSMLKKNMGYMFSDIVRRIQADVQLFISSLNLDSAPKENEASSDK